LDGLAGPRQRNPPSPNPFIERPLPPLSGEIKSAADLWVTDNLSAVTDAADGGAQPAVPARFPTPDGAPEPTVHPALTAVGRGGQSWQLGTNADVAWIAGGTTVGKTITSAIPPVFDAYATILLPEDRDDHQLHDNALLSVLRDHTALQPWWLGYLDTGADDVVFPCAPRVTLYSGWPYVLVQAGPEQAGSWRRWDYGSYWRGHLPNLMFPADRSWVVSTLWDDDWTCIGGSAAIVNSFQRRPELAPLTRQVELGTDATPPGHHAT
jgi:hypothetical protein